jgi:hypothetical protein
MVILYSLEKRLSTLSRRLGSSHDYNDTSAVSVRFERSAERWAWSKGDANMNVCTLFPPSHNHHVWTYHCYPYRYEASFASGIGVAESVAAGVRGRGLN